MDNIGHGGTQIGLDGTSMDRDADAEVAEELLLRVDRMKADDDLQWARTEAALEETRLLLAMVKVRSVEEDMVALEKVKDEVGKLLELGKA